ncbi:hypothetical protein AB0O47_40230 [Streptomyces noursei]|uniref:hypothetical protein n=1 Tax=Streptomyces noursei TaxID=1971 RepID=UPI00344F0BE4
MKRARALIETDPTTGDVCVRLRPQDLREGLFRQAVIDSVSEKPHPDDPPLTPEHWAHLEAACGPGPLEGLALRMGAVGIRESAVQALAHRGLVTLYYVRVGRDVATWAGVPTAEGHAAVRARQRPAAGHAAVQGRT